MEQKAFYGNYQIFDGTYFYESYYLIKKFNEKVLELTIDNFCPQNKLVSLEKLIKRLGEKGFGKTRLYKNSTFLNKKEKRYSIDWFLFIKDEKIILDVSHSKVKELADINFKLRDIIAIESVGLETLQEVFDIASECLVEVEDDAKRYINVVTSLPREGLALDKHEINKPNIPDLDLYYGKGFKDKHERFIELMHEKDKSGLFIFHGLTGSGKTNYIRYLISQSKSEMNFIFYPITLLSQITSPQLLTFISNYKNAVLIIEESEDSVQTRDNFNTDKTSIANLLNISDGLLSDVLNLKIISTFNTDIRNLDKALLREGRLLGIHKFDKISVENANEIAKMNKLERTFDEDVTLAQVFNQPLKSDFSDFVLNNEKKIGFKK